MANYKHWQTKKDDQALLWLTLDRKEHSVNTINTEVLSELEAIIESIEQDSQCQGVIITSGKAHGFIAGADIQALQSAESIEPVEAVVKQGHRVFNRLEKLKIPTVALIDGFCLGGGTEFVLACRYRVAERENTLIGLPEVKLGVHPGWGGSVRLVRLIGAPKAMELILTGRPKSAKSAAKLGLVDVAVPQRHLIHAAQHYALKSPKQNHPTIVERATNWTGVRGLLSKVFEKKTRQKVRPDHYPAPFSAIDNWRQYGTGAQAFEAEQRSFLELVQQPTSRNLFRAFFLQERLKGFGKAVSFRPQYVHVIGAGAMGGGIAAWIAKQGFTVTLQDQKPEMIAPAIQRAHQLFSKKFKSQRPIQAALDRLIPDEQGQGVKRADVIIEAIPEDLDLKQKLFSHLESHIKKEAILATNTSSLSLDDIAKSMKNPKRLLGLHFFNPVHMMQLVEVIQGAHTDSNMVKQALAFVRQIDRLPLPVKNSPGFLVNRILFPYLIEGVQLYEEGVSLTSIDQAGEDFGMPMGPLKLADYVGLDIFYHSLKQYIETTKLEIPKSLQEKVEAGHLGKKTGQGYYKWSDWKTTTHEQGKKEVASSALQSRLIYPMLNTAVACWREGIVEDADLIDAGMIFATGFAPFRGGPMQYIRSESPDTVRQKLDELAQNYGERFKPDPGWEKW